MVRIAAGFRALVFLLIAGPIAAQDVSPVYVDDSPTAEEVLAQLPRLLAQENTAEASSNIQRLLDEEPNRLVVNPQDPELYESVRDRLHQALLASPALLERYRLTQEPRARKLLEEGNEELVERSLLLTRSGALAALEIAQEHFESARFQAATRTLAQLATHPDILNDPALAGRCARQLIQITPFAQGDGARRLTLAMAAIAGVENELTPEAMKPVAPPDSALTQSIGLAEVGPPLSPGDVLARPLRSAPIRGSGTLAEASLLRGQRLSSGEPTPWIMPVLAGDLVLLNDSSRLTAWDRVTLTRLWQYEPEPSNSGSIEVPDRMFRRIGESALQDSSAVAADGGVAVCVLDPSTGRTPGVPELHAVTLESGEPLWSVRASTLRTDWVDAAFSGPPTIVEGQVLSVVFQFSPLRRVMSAHLAALDLYTGELRWSLLVGTAGVSPSQRLDRIAHLLTAVEGLVYFTDPIGIIGTVEAETGRPVWIRRVPGEEGFAGSSRDAWEQPAPIVLGDRLIVVSPNQLRVMVLGRADGRVVGEREASALGWPEYLLSSGDTIVSVGPDITAIESGMILTGEPRSLAAARAERAPGRVRLAGNELIVPTPTGALVLNPRESEQSLRRISLDYAGAPVGLGDQLIVADDSYVHAYLPWPTAEAALRERMLAAPDDPDVALTYAELAYRAGAVERIPEAADAALSAIDRLAQSERALQARDRLYESLLAMLSAVGTDGPSFVPAQQLSLKIREELAQRLGKAATSATQRVGYLMEMGRLAEAQKSWDSAAEAYQAVLLDDELARSQHVLGRHRQRAEISATSALRLLIGDHPRAYGSFDEQASELYKSLTAPESAASADDLERLASRYPVARVAPEVLLTASDRLLAQGMADRSIGALERALSALEAQPERRWPSETISGEIIGRLVVALAENDRLFAASQTLQRLRERKPALRLTDRGSPLEAQTLADLLSGRLASLARLPRVAAQPTALGQLLIGWGIVEPLSAAGSVPTNHLMLSSRSLGQIALFGMNSEPTDELAFDSAEVLNDAPGELRPIWSRPAPQGGEPTLVRLEPAWAMLLWGKGDEAQLELIDTVTGRTRWRTPAFGELFDEEPPRRRTGMVETPLDGPSRLSDLMIVISDHHAALIERTGRTAVFELTSGEAVWTPTLDVPVVYEAAMSGGVLALVGERPADVNAGEQQGVVPLLASYDVRERKLLEVNDELASLLRWVRVDKAGQVVVGLDRGVIATNPRARSVRWLVDDPAVRLSGDAWLLHDRALVLGPDRQVWQIDTETGALRDAPLEDLGRIGGSSRIDVREGPNASAVFATDHGLIVFDRSGSLVGGDATSGLTYVLPPVPGEGVYAMLQTEGRPHSVEGDVYRLWTLDTTTGVIQGHADLHLLHEPEALVLLDGAMVVGTPGATLVYQAPAKAEPNR